MNYTVYIHINIINHKVYIGITSKAPEKRWGKNGIGYKGSVFYNAIQKYGWNNFKHIILFEGLSQEYACYKEIELISLYKSNDNRYGYNISKGGDKNTLGIKFSKDVRKIMSEAHKGQIPWNKGLSPEKCYGYKIPRTLEVKNKIKQNHKCKKQIICLETKEVFSSIHEAGDILNLDYRLISAVCRGKRKTTGNLHFMFLDCYDKNKKYDISINKNNKPKSIFCVETGKIFSSISECSNIMKINKSDISLVLSGKYKQTHGYTFKIFNRGDGER